MAMKHVRNVYRVIALNVICRRVVYNSNHVRAFTHGKHEPEVVISHHLRHLAGL